LQLQLTETGAYRLQKEQFLFSESFMQFSPRMN